MLTELRDRGGLVLRAQLGTHVTDPGLGGEGAGGAGVIAGEHGDPDALCGEGADDLGDLGAQFVADANRGDRRAVAVDDDDRHALLLQARDPVAEGPGVEPAGTADRDPRAIELTFDAVAGLLGHALRRRGARRGSGDRGGEGVGAVLLQRGRPRQRLLLGDAVGGEDCGDGGLVAGQGAGLVDSDVADHAEPFERRTGLDDHTELARRPDRSHHRQRHRDRQRARRRRHQHDQGAGDPQLRVAEQRPDDRDERSEDEYAGHERAGDTVGEAGAVALLCLRLLHQVDDRGQRVVGARCGRLDLQRTSGVDRAGRYGVAGLDLDRDRLPRDR